MTDPLAPQPPPLPGGVAIWPLVQRDVRARWYEPAHRARLTLGGIASVEVLLRDMERRDKDGAKKYGRRLEAGNGRTPLIDAYQEALDLCVYLRQEIEEHGADPEVIALYNQQIDSTFRLRVLLTARGYP